MRWIAVILTLGCAAGGWAQEAVHLPAPRADLSRSDETFRFVSDGPRGPGWSRPDEIARKYFHDNLTGEFERTIALDGQLAPRTTLRWIFTGPRAGLTVELTSTEVRIVERYYDSMGLYDGQGNYPQRTLVSLERQYIGPARTLTVIADGHLGVKVQVNGAELLDGPLLFDLTRHQLMYAAPRTAHDVVEGALLRPEVRPANVTLDPGEIHQTMLGFGGSPSIPAYAELSDQGKREYWQLLRHYNLLLSREYPMGTELKPDLSNLENLNDATPHYYGDNFPNSEVSSFDYSRQVLALGGSVIYEMWALPEWATEPYSGPPSMDSSSRSVKRAAKPDEYARIVVEYCLKAKEATGQAPEIVGIENEVEQPPEIFDAMVLTLRRALDRAGFSQTKIHMADASYMFLGVERAEALKKDPAVWTAIDYAATHEYDFQEFLSNPDMYDAEMQAMHQASAGKPFLATEICFNDPRYQEPSYRIALAAAQLYHKNLTELDAVALMYCWLLLDVEQPTFAGSRALLEPERTRGWIPVPTSFELRVLGAYSRHILKGMRRIEAQSGDPNLLVSAFADKTDETLVIVNRAVTARAVTVSGAARPWTEIERTGLEEDNAVGPLPAQIVVEPGEIVVLSTVKAG
jgi:O-glycosyl hydrolase